MLIPTNYHFKKVTDSQALTKLKHKWRESLPRPQDGMWESFRESAVHWGISVANEMIGYACVDQEDQLLQFYILQEYLSDGEAIFKLFLDKVKVKHGMVGTNNLTYLSLAMNFVKKVEVDTFLFSKAIDVTLAEKEGTLRKCEAEDSTRVIDFYHHSIGAPKAWLTGYVGGLIEKGEIFVLEKEDEIIGTCEVRISETAPAYADIGMAVSPDYRRKGYGTYLLYQAKEIAQEWGKIPICSCEKENEGSAKSIQNCGFRSQYQLLKIIFKY